MNRYLKLLIIVWLLIAFLLPCEAQRGRSSSSRRSSRMSSHSKKSKQCTRADGKSCKPNEGDAMFALSIYLCLLVPLITFGCICERKKENERIASINSSLSQYQQQLDKDPSSLSRDQKLQLKTKLEETYYLMQIYSFDQSQQLKCYLKLSKIESIKQDKYSVVFNASDEIGRSQLQGILSFRNQWMCFKLSKTYANRKRARQVNSFKVILYEGMGNAESMQGNWHFKGHNKSQKYAGYWIMKPQ